MKKYKNLLLLLIFNSLFFIPVIIKPEIYLGRSNDLNEFFRPLILYSKQHILNGTFPLWNTTMFSGTPLLPDPQSQLIYPLNVIFLFLPIGISFFVSSLFHIFLGSLGVYLLSRKILKLNETSSLITAIIYTFTSRSVAFLMAGHFGLIIATAWIPYVVLSVFNLSKKPKFTWSVLLGLSLSGLFYSHTTTFFFSTIISLLLLTVLIFTNEILPVINYGVSTPKGGLPLASIHPRSKERGFLEVAIKKREVIKTIVFYILGGVLTFGLVAITFIPQLYWMPQTNRAVLTEKVETYPTWNSKKNL